MTNTVRIRYYLPLPLLFTSCTSDGMGVKSDATETLLMLFGLACWGSIIYVVYLLVKKIKRYFNNEGKGVENSIDNNVDYITSYSKSDNSQLAKVIAEKIFSISKTIYPNVIDSNDPKRNMVWAEEYILCLRQFLITAGNHKEFHSDHFLIHLYNTVNSFIKLKIGITLPSNNQLSFIQDKVAFYNEEVNNVVIAMNKEDNFIPFKLLYSLYMNPLKSVKEIENKADDHFANNFPSYAVQYRMFLDSYPLIVIEMENLLKSV